MLRVNQLYGFGGGEDTVPHFIAATDYYFNTDGAGFSHTVTLNASTKAVIIFISTNITGGPPSIASAPTLGGVATTIVTGSPTTGGARTYVYYKNNPASGTLAYTFTAAEINHATVIELSAPIAAPTNYTTDVTSNWSVTVTPTPVTGVILWGITNSNSSATPSGQTLGMTQAVDGKTDACCVPFDIRMNVAYANNTGAALTWTATGGGTGVMWGIACGPA